MSDTQETGTITILGPHIYPLETDLKGPYDYSVCFVSKYHRDTIVDRQETTKLVRKCAVESQVVVYILALGHLGQVTYQCRDSPESHWNISHARLGSCSQGGIVYTASTNWAFIAA